MIRVLVVEDEPPILSAIVKLINQLNENFQVVGTAINGKRALEFLEDNKVDVIFSDIKMPILDGLKLAEIVKEKYSHILVIIISGFAQFEYARQALQCNVFDYLLKPLKPEEMNQILKKISEYINEKKEVNKKEALKKAIEDNKDYSENQDTHALMLICVGQYPLALDDSILPANYFYSRYNLEHIVEPLLLDGESLICLNGKSLAEKYIVLKVDSIARIHILANSIFENLFVLEHIPIALIVKDQLVGIEKIGASFIELRMGLYKNIKLFKSEIIVLGKDETEKFIDNMDMDYDLLAGLKVKNAMAIHNSVELIVQRFIDKNSTQYEFLHYLEKKTLNYFENILNIQNSIHIKSSIHYAISNVVTREELIEELVQIFYSAVNDEATHETCANRELSEKIADYLALNYKNEITNRILGREFGFTATHLSKKFREHFNISIPEYLNNFRIEMAKGLFVDNPHLMIKEIAILCGFNDQYYFSKMFKKATGKWPTQYKKDMGLF